MKGGKCVWEVVVGGELSFNSKPPPIGCNDFCILSKFISSCGNKIAGNEAMEHEAMIPWRMG